MNIVNDIEMSESLSTAYEQKALSYRNINSKNAY